MAAQTKRMLVLKQKPYGEIHNVLPLVPQQIGYIFLPFAHGARSGETDDEYQRYITFTPNEISMDCEGIHRFHQDHGYTFDTTPSKIRSMFDSTVRETTIGGTIAVEKRSYDKDAEKGSVYILQVLESPVFKEFVSQAQGHPFKALCSKVKVIAEGYIGRTASGARGYLLQSAQMRNVEF
jgi:hypothetical protein